MTTENIDTAQSKGSQAALVAFAVGDAVELSLTRTSQRRIILSLRTAQTGMVDIEMSLESYADMAFGVAQVPAAILRQVPNRKPLQTANTFTHDICGVCEGIGVIGGTTSSEPSGCLRDTP